ncbi:MAG: hypothetical protein D6813_10465, partial [Calditrichaeota bacterium]
SLHSFLISLFYLYILQTHPLNPPLLAQERGTFFQFYSINPSMFIEFCEALVGLKKPEISF